MQGLAHCICDPLLAFLLGPGKQYVEGWGLAPKSKVSALCLGDVRNIGLNVVGARNRFLLYLIGTIWVFTCDRNPFYSNIHWL